MDDVFKKEAKVSKAKRNNWQQLIVRRNLRGLLFKSTKFLFVIAESLKKHLFKVGNHAP